MLNIIHTPAARFACGRTCTPGHLCRFSAILAAIGTTRVMSHTVKVEVQLKNTDALKAAILGLKGTVMGDGTHKIEYRDSTGYGFTLPNWRYPLVLEAAGKLAFSSDDAWTNRDGIALLTAKYAIEAARQAADGQGWSSEDQQDGSLLIHHPSGGSMTVQPDGTVDNVGFVGNACDIASVIEEAMGTPGTPTFRPEYFEQSGLRV